MSGFVLWARLKLIAGEGWRTTGWRGLCALDGITASDGATVFGCEVNVDGADRFSEDEEVIASLRFWIPPSEVEGVHPGLGLRLFDGLHHIGSGTILEATDTREES